jgi:hypothetical protein
MDQPARTAWASRSASEGVQQSVVALVEACNMRFYKCVSRGLAQPANSNAAIDSSARALRRQRFCQIRPRKT